MKFIFLTTILLFSTLSAQRQTIIDRSSTSIQRAFRNNGGSASTLMAINKSLVWFQNKQNPDGSWGKAAQATLTAFVIKAYLANGILPNSTPMGGTLKKAIDFLSKQEISPRNGRAYGHAIQTIAIAEVYGMTGDQKLKELLNKSIKVIIEGQQKNGGYDYFFKNDSERQDLSISSWSFQALKSAKEVGCTEAGLDRAITQSMIFLIKHTTGKNEFFYSTRGDQSKTGKAKHTMRAAGTLSLINFFNGTHKDLKNDLKIISTDDLQDLNWKTPPREALYGWFYATQAMFHSGSSKWKSWYKILQKEYLANQNEDGSWTYPGVFHASPMDDSLTKQVYATSLSILALSTPHRFPKDRTNAVYKVPAVKK